MLLSRFDKLLELIKPMIMKKSTIRAPFPSNERQSLIGLMIYDFRHLVRTFSKDSLRFLASDKSHISLR